MSPKAPHIIDFDDRIWPKLLQQVCAGSLVEFGFAPIADGRRGAVAGYRAIARYPQLGNQIVDWPQAAERHGYRARLVATTLAAVLTCRATLPPDSFLLVELDAGALRSDGVLSVLRAAGDLSAVVLEVESFDGVRDHRQLMHALDVAREHGGRVCLRATGRGHADPLQLADLAPHFVKLGPELVCGIDQQPRRAALLTVTTSLTQQLGAEVLVDGVSRPEELEVLRNRGIRLISGPLVGRESDVPRPLAPEAISEFSIFGPTPKLVDELSVVRAA